MREYGSRTMQPQQSPLTLLTHQQLVLTQPDPRTLTSHSRSHSPAVCYNTTSLTSPSSCRRLNIGSSPWHGRIVRVQLHSSSFRPPTRVHSPLLIDFRQHPIGPDLSLPCPSPSAFYDQLSGCFVWFGGSVAAVSAFSGFCSKTVPFHRRRYVPTAIYRCTQRLDVASLHSCPFFRCRPSR